MNKKENSIILFVEISIVFLMPWKNQHNIILRNKYSVKKSTNFTKEC